MQAFFIPMTNVLSISRLCFSVSGKEILNDLKLDVAEHQYFAIAGVNGAGKSTLIKLILDLIRPTTSERLDIYGKPNQATQSRDRLTYLPEKFDVKKSVTGLQYLNFVGSMYGLSIDRNQINALSERLDFIPDRLNTKVASYSKGMVQKLGLISCFMLDRDFLILDEPLSGLDPQARYHFKRLLLEEKSKGRTILYSTHLLADAEEICDQFGILHEGRMEFSGPPELCLQTYQADNLEQAYMQCVSSTDDTP